MTLRITEIRIHPPEGFPMKAMASIVLDDSIRIDGIGIVLGSPGPFITMPSRQVRDGTFRALFRPRTREAYKWMESQILAAYHGESGRLSSAEEPDDLSEED